MKALELKKTRRCSRGFRGFVGPLGDDIPSIFPIVAGVMLFFGTIAFAGNLVAQKNAYLEVRKAALSLSYIVTEKGFVTDATWQQKCEALKKAADANQVRVLATIKRFCGEVVFPGEGGLPQLSPYYAASTDEGNLRWTWRACTNDEKINEKLESGASVLFVPGQRSYSVVLNYPVAVPCPDESSSTFGHGILNVIIWRG